MPTIYYLWRKYFKVVSPFLVLDITFIFCVNPNALRALLEIDTKIDFERVHGKDLTNDHRMITSVVMSNTVY